MLFLFFHWYKKKQNSKGATHLFHLWHIITQPYKNLQIHFPKYNINKSGQIKTKRLDTVLNLIYILKIQYNTNYLKKLKNEIKCTLIYRHYSSPTNYTILIKKTIRKLKKKLCWGWVTHELLVLILTIVNHPNINKYH